MEEVLVPDLGADLAIAEGLDLGRAQLLVDVVPRDGPAMVPVLAAGGVDGEDPRREQGACETEPQGLERQMILRDVEVGQRRRLHLRPLAVQFGRARAQQLERPRFGRIRFGWTLLTI